jgi:protein TonB
LEGAVRPITWNEPRVSVLDSKYLVENERGGVCMSDLGSSSQSFSKCLVDSDSDARSRSRRLLRKALALSVVFEFALVAALILWPLFSPSVLATQYILTPLPPYAGGGGAPNHPHSSPQPPPISHVPTICLAVCAPITRSYVPADHSDAPDVGPGEGESGGGGLGLPGNGPGVPGSIGDTPVVLEPPRPEKPSPRPMRRSGEIMAAMLVHRVDPAYPAIARAAHISGVVHLRAIIGKDGTVRELEVVDGNLLLAQAAKAAVEKWRYRPTMLNGEPVEVETYVTVNFVLN